MNFLRFFRKIFSSALFDAFFAPKQRINAYVLHIIEREYKKKECLGE